ncbi:TonB-dependent receptor [Marinifilum sp. D714]|uniref:TonB-dependent receptor n=1 Tax=Marinifilum sp. D714 TaxID=2937523 RepID=UPI0027C5908B|nr:TonB-dependent receptor [Marinifilum sp. D714]MDQ2178440.1 TonB-dependent receptor [Marinifilum sp. D714]
MKNSFGITSFFEKRRWKKTLMRMKLLTMLMLVGVLQLSANVKGQNAMVNMSMHNANLIEFFSEIADQTDYEFLYNYDLVLSKESVNLEVNHEDLKELLEDVLYERDLDYELEDNVIIISEREFVAPIAVATPVKQEKKVTGMVTDNKGLGLPGVSVLVKGTSTGTATDIDGNYTLAIPEGTKILVFSFIGMMPQEVTYTGQTTINVTLTPDTEQMEEVVVVGYGKVDKKDLTGTVATVKSEELQLVKTQTIDAALAGQMTGVHVSSSGGAPGSGNIVHIRGLSGITGDNQPLYVVDGVPIIQNPNFGTLGLGTYGQRENPLLSINPNDIERVDVLKDASAAAIYGSRAANGVILITTKRGKRNMAPKVNFSVNATIQNPTDKFDYMNAEEFKGFVTEQAQATLDNSTYPEEWWSFVYPTQMQIVSDPDGYFGDADTDWQDEVTNKNALWTQYNMNVSGGSESVNYMVSATVSDQEGLMLGNRFKRYNLSSSLDANISKRFKVGTSINYNYAVNKSSGIMGLSDGAFRPDIAPYNEDGSFTTYQDANFGELFNPLGDAAKVRNKAISQNIYGSVYSELEILKDLKLRTAININLNNDRTSNYTPSYTSNAKFYEVYYSEPGGRLYKQRNDGYAIAFENVLTYNKTFNDVHKFNAMAGISWDRSRLDLESQTYRGFPDDDIMTNINSANIVDDYSSESIENGLNSVFGRINYVYDNRYMATFTARYDGSTKFGPENQRGFFPSGALAWNIHHEDFLEGDEVINKLKVRASLGRTGSDNLPSFSYLAYYQSQENGYSFYDGVNGIVVTGVPNTGIKWETTDQLDLGLEFGLFNNRLYGELVYFEKNTSDIILGVAIPSETGSSRWQNNIADVSNKGWEIMLGGDIIRGKNFTWTSAFNISFVENKVDALNGGSTSQYGSSGIIEGEPIGVVSGYDVIKIAQTQEEIDDLNASAGGQYQSSLTQPGDYIFRDANGDGKITNDDRVALGDINPEYYGGWNNRISYKNFELGMNWAFVQGSERAYDAITNLSYANVQSNSSRIVFETWTPENTDAKYARLGSSSHGYIPTSKSVVDASYIRLRSLSLTYNLPKSLLSKIGVYNAKISLSGNNLVTITDYPGLDPESVNSQRGGSTVDLTSDGGYAYPQAKTYTVGLNVTF